MRLWGRPGHGVKLHPRSLPPDEGSLSVRGSVNCIMQCRLGADDTKDNLHGVFQLLDPAVCKDEDADFDRYETA